MDKTLYKLDSKNKLRSWNIKVVGNKITSSSGLDSGKKVTTTEEILVGKNIGKRNETSASEQALVQAISKLNKKTTTGYTSIKPSVQEENELTFPMLAHEYPKHEKKVKFPCMVQPKLDGYRMIYRDGKMLTRTLKEYTILKDTDLHKELMTIRDYVLDGEMYNPEMQFESYGLLRKKKVSPKEFKELNKIIYNVYDIIVPGLTFKERYNLLKEIVKTTKHIKLVKAIVCPDKKCLVKSNTKYIEEGYEGSMVRNTDSFYKSKRSHDLLKFKQFNDAEFKVIDYTCEKDTKGDGLNPVVWICSIPRTNLTFNVPSKGSRKERDELYRNGDKYINKQLTVQFFGYTNTGVPRFPKTLRDGKSSFRMDK